MPCPAADSRPTVEGVEPIKHDGPDFPYVILAARLRTLAEGMRPGQALPSITRLSQESGLSVKTVRKAIAVLEAEGLVHTIPSRGTYVV
jgi:DNA-binding GntR family transcriptional regulator